MERIVPTDSGAVAAMTVAALEAGAAVMARYHHAAVVTTKADRSPLTEADRASDARIAAVLHAAMTQGALPRLPLLSEEGEAYSYRERAGWSAYFLVDPLDGTKEFVQRNGEFTVNIALVQRGTGGAWYPHAGVVYAPALGELFAADDGVALHWTGIAPGGPAPRRTDAVVLPRADRLRDRPYTVVASRSHRSASTRRFIEARRRDVPDLQLVYAGSSLKLCRVADGSADEYPRLAPTMEWDTAAGDAIARAAGCEVRAWDRTRETVGDPLAYNKEDLHNPHFLVRRNRS